MIKLQNNLYGIMIVKITIPNVEKQI